VVIHAGETVRLSFAIAAAKSREEAVELAREYQSTTIASRVFELAWTHSQVELRYLNIRANQANLYQHMLSQILFLSPGRKSRSESIRQNHKGQSGLWSYGISGDLPIVLLKVNSLDHINLVRQVLTAHEYWRLKGLSIDLVILNEFENRYDQPLQERLRDIIAMSHARDMQDKPGGVFLRQSANIEEHDRILLMAAARIVLYGDKGTIADQIKVEMEKGDLPEPFMPSLPTYPAEDFRIPPMPKDIMFFNGLGGFLKNGKEYWIRLYENQNTPMPWVNIIANQQYGFLVTERGSGYTWAYNSRENKITPWSNDPIIDPAGEILYLRDEESGEVWTITPGPIRKKTVYTVRHGLGYSTFEVTYLGLEQSLTLFVDIREPVKLFHIRLKNNSGKTRTLSATLYVEFVLGVHRQQNAPYIVTGYDESSGALIAQNSFNEEFKDNMAFLYALSSDVAYTGDRTEFLGRNGTAACPAALQRKGLSGNTGAGYDPCGVLQFNIHMEADEEKTVDFILGCGKGIEHVRSLVEMFKDNASIEESLQRVADFWTEKTTVLQVNTPDPSMNIMLNQWLLYQTWVSRYWARTGFYQAGGAYGFRDQLQDVMSLVFSGPEVTKEQILRCAAHQFKEGDVQHWWHPPYRGVRTKITDDLLFLPYVTADYIEITGDWSILDIEEHYLETEHLRPDQEDLYIIPAVSEEVGTIYDHCIRAIEHALQFGEHGLPLMGTGDWNDGMNSVGDEGKGESVWLGWFLYCVLKRFIPICDARGDMEHVEKYSKIKDELINSIETHAWDGGWYRRAYFDDGRPLGSQENDECSIDSISQSWAVISGAARPGRISEAMLALENHLIRRDEGLIQLLAPAFDKSDIEPGYIKGYVPGVRENGGQYTHAAAWTVLAFAKLGNGEKAWELYNLLNPINHARTSIEVAKYKVEPYVMAADVYAVYPHTGRGGWTWYTGSAGWMYRVGIEWILGFKLSHGNKLAIEPCIPPHWQEYAIDYRFKTTKYQIKIENPQGVMSGVKEIIVDGRKQEDRFIELLDDGSQHEVKIIMG